VLHQKPAIEKSKNRHLSFGDIDHFNSARVVKPGYKSERKKPKSRSSSKLVKKDFHQIYKDEILHLRQQLNDDPFGDTFSKYYS